MTGRRAVALRIVLVACLAWVAACAPGRKARTIVFWQFWAPDVVTPLVAAFEREHPGWKVQMEQLTWQSGLEKITAAVGSGKVPDLCELGSTWMPRMLASGQLTEWSQGIQDLRPGLRGWELCSTGDRVFGIPWVMGTRALFYNKTLFARAGLDSTRPPETWEELEQAAAAIQKLGGDVRGFGVQAGERYVLFKKFMPFAWGNGGRILSDDLAKSEFDSPQNVEALTFYAGLRKFGVVERQDMLDRAFKEGRLGLQVSGAWLFRSISKEAPGLRYGVALVPRPDRERGFHASFAGGECLVSFAAAKEKEGALALARFLARPENAQALAAAAQSVQPATIGADTSAYYRERPNEQLMIRQFETAVPTPNHAAWVDLEAAIEDEVEQALYDRKSAAQAVADAHRRIAERLAKP
ncbi:MAG: extracellular solute-binding protein [Candidatus Eiseniibacteriota bacterium]